MTTTSFLGLKKPGDNDAINISDLNYNADKLDAFAAAQIAVSVLAADAEDNPTSGACAGIMLTATSSSNADVGLRIFAGTNGDIYAAAKDSNGWLVWNAVVEIE